MKFMLNRDRTLATTKGHTLEFKKGQLVHVPPECHQEVIAIGAVPEHELEEEEKVVGARPEDPIEAEKALFAVFKDMVLRNERKEFTAGGVPHPKAIEKYLGWTVDAKERDQMWQKFQQADKD